MKIALEEDVSNARDVQDCYYRMGNHNALSGLCTRLGIDLTEHIKAHNYKLVLRQKDEILWEFWENDDGQDD